MEEIVYEIIGGAVILALILVVILMFRNSATLVRNTAGKETKNSFVSMDEMIGVSGGVYKGAKIKEAVAYAEVSDVPTEVWVKKSGGFIKTTDKEVWLNDSNKYKLEILYLNQLTNRTGGAETSDLLTESGAKDVELVRFLFEKQ